MKKYLAQVVFITHLALIFFVLFAALLPMPYPLINIFFIPAVLLHWKTNDGVCVLTDLEYKLKNQVYKKDIENSFSARLMRVFGIQLNEEHTMVFIYALKLISWIFCCVKTFNYF